MTQEIAGDHRLRALIDTGILLSSELTLEALLEKILDTALALTGARYAALGVIDRAGTGLERFIQRGLQADEVAQIGELPRGRGLLGVLIRERTPLRLVAIADDPRSVGFPPGHPPMNSFLGVPIGVRGGSFGNLYLTEKSDPDGFSEEDEETARLLAAQAAVAIENARLYESAREWSRQLESLNEVSAALATRDGLTELFALAAERLCQLLDARIVVIQTPTANGEMLTTEAASGERAALLLGRQVRLRESKAGNALLRQRVERVDSLLDDPEADQDLPRLVEASSALYVPLLVQGRPSGVIVAYDRRGADSRFTDADLRLAQAFGHRASVAIALSERVGREAVRALLAGMETERTRLARELHDETGQALASILLGLGRLEKQVGTEALVAVRSLVSSALEDVRRLTTELRPPALDDFGLTAALERLAHVISERSGLDIRVHSRIEMADLTRDQETAVYRIVQEALTNTVKHASARSVSVVLSCTDGALRVAIEDDGVGFDPTKIRDGALGLVGVRERATLLGGHVEIESAPGSGTSLLVEIPQDECC